MDISDLHTIAVGQPYIPGRTGYPECAEFLYDVGGYQFLLSFRRPAPAELAAVRDGPVEWALHLEEEILHLLYRFMRPAYPAPDPAALAPAERAAWAARTDTVIPWSEAAFTWWLVPPERRALPDPRPGHALVQIIFLDAGSGIVLALRACTLSEAFTARLGAALRAQAAGTPLDYAEYLRRARLVQSRYPRSDDMARVAEVRCFGGE